VGQQLAVVSLTTRCTAGCSRREFCSREPGYPHCMRHSASCGAGSIMPEGMHATKLHVPCMLFATAAMGRPLEWAM